MGKFILSALVFIVIIFLLVWLRLIWQADRASVDSRPDSPVVKELLPPKE